MNDPYSTPTRYREADLEAWNAEIARARREYRLHPFAKCEHFGVCTRRWRRAQRRLA